MDTLTIFLTQFVMSVLVYALIAKWYVSPWLAQKSKNEALQILLLPHAFRHLGLVFLVPTFVTDGLATPFANAAAYGDFAAAILAIFALFLIRAKSSLAIPLVWIFNLIGTVDLINALRQAENVPHLGIAWFIPTFVVPLLLVSHAMIFLRLLHRGAGQTRDQVTA